MDLTENVSSERHPLTKTTLIDPITTIPLHIESFLDGEGLMSGTGFIISHDADNYLITNWHVVTCRNPLDNQPLLSTGQADPNKLNVWYHLKDRLGAWISLPEELLDNDSGDRKWLEHPDGSNIDIVALPISNNDKAIIYPLDLKLSYTDLIISPSESVSIVGFPYGVGSLGKFPIWKTGHIASDIDLNYKNKPVFLIDATTKPGMSGAPVIAKRIGMQKTSTGFKMSGESTKFLGIYSGRILDDSDIGMVWKPDVLDSILP